MPNQNTTITTQRAGWPAKEWRHLAGGMCNATFYNILKKHPDRIQVVKVFSKTVVLTDPREFLLNFSKAA